jgi:hypothetical protein
LFISFASDGEIIALGFQAVFTMIGK